MTATAIDSAEDRRIGQHDINSFWHLLTLAQKVALNKLNQFGYQLAFARSQNNVYLAFAKCNSTYATIDYSGEVELDPKIHIR